MPSPENETQSLITELKSNCEIVKTTKNTCFLYNFRDSIEKCLQDKKISERKTIIECFEQLNNLLPSKLLENLLTKAIELNDRELVHIFIKNVQILEESQAVDCIKYFLRSFDDNPTNANESNKFDNDLNKLFLKAYDYRLFTNELKRLSSNEFLICLQYLLRNLKKSLEPNVKLIKVYTNDENEESVNSTIVQNDDLDEKTNEKPNNLQIVELFCCFVDAHFTHITLSNKSQEIIAETLQLIETQLDLFVDLISIESLIKEVKQNRKFQLKNNNANIGHYYIEVLKI